jgi:diacylglycerol kinase family enzyme
MAMSGEQAAPARVALIYSLHAGSAWRVDPAALLRLAGLDVVDTLPVAELSAQRPEELISRWRVAGVRALIAAGGDGSAGAVATVAARAGLPLGILPLGTANDTARALDLPERPAAAARLIARQLASGQERLIDAGELVATSESGYFLHALTLGLNVEFARLATNALQRKRWGKLTYAASAIESLAHFTSLPVTLTVAGMEGKSDGGPTTISAHIALLAAINLPVFGGWMELRVPTVHDDDRLLDFILIEAPDMKGVAGIVGAFELVVQDMLAAVERGGIGERQESVAFPGARWFRARSVAIETPTPAQFTLDGELRGTTPAVVRVAAGRARVLAPRPRLTPRATLKQDAQETTSSVGERLAGPEE